MRRGYIKMQFKLFTYIIILFLLIMSLVMAAYGAQEVDPRFDPYDTDQITNANSATINANIDKIASSGNLDKVEVTKLSNENVNKYVNKLSLEQKKDLNAQQLAYVDSATKKSTLDLVKANEVSKEERDKALKLLGRTDEIIDTEIGTDQSQITTYDDGFSIDHIRYIQIGDLKVHSADGFSYRDNEIVIDSADTIEIKDGILSNVTNFTGDSIEFSVGEVKKVLNGGIIIDDVSDSNFTITDSYLKIVSEEGTDFQITDTSLSQTTFEAISDEGSILITKEIPAEYTISNGTLIFNSTSFSETLIANSTITATLDPNYGFSFISITPPGTYYYNDKNILKDFAVHIPPYGEKYNLCVKKDEIQNFNGIDCDGFIDFPEKKLSLDGIADYLRYQFNDNGVLTDLFLKPAYEGKNTQVKMNASLDSDFIFLNSIFIGIKNNEIIQCNEEKTISETFNLNYHIIEICNPLVNEVERYIGFKENNPNVINKYNSNFGTKHSEITFNNKILTVNNKKTKANFYSENIAKTYYKQELDTYQLIFNCDRYSNLFGDKKTLYEWYLE